MEMVDHVLRTERLGGHGEYCGKDTLEVSVFQGLDEQDVGVKLDLPSGFSPREGGRWRKFLFLHLEHEPAPFHSSFSQILNPQV